MSLDRLKTLAKISRRIDLKNEPKVNKNFYAVNMHGFETHNILKIPKGIRVVMYCYSGEALYVCEKLDQFIWENVLLNPDAVVNYHTFISALAGSPMFRDHFCVYNPGDTIPDIMFGTDKEFRDGIFRLPIKGAVYDGVDTLYVSDESVFPDVISRNEDIRIVKVSRKDTAKLISYKGYQNIIFSDWKIPLKVSALSKIIDEMKALGKEGTILLLTCREGLTDLPGKKDGKFLYDELGDLIKGDLEEKKFGFSPKRKKSPKNSTKNSTRNSTRNSPKKNRRKSR